MYKNILVVVDYQRDFVSPEGALYVPEAETVAARIQQEIDNPKYDAIVYTMDTHIKEDYASSKEVKIFPLHCEFNTKGWEFFIIRPRSREVRITVEEGVLETPRDFSVENEFVFMKDEFSVWEGNSQYETWIRDNVEKEASVTVVGVATNYCVFQNAMGYEKLGISSVSVIGDAVRGIPDDTYEAKVIEMKDQNVRFR